MKYLPGNVITDVREPVIGRQFNNCGQQQQKKKAFVFIECLTRFVVVDMSPHPGAPHSSKKTNECHDRRRHLASCTIGCHSYALAPLVNATRPFSVEPEYTTWKTSFRCTNV